MSTPTTIVPGKALVSENGTSRSESQPASREVIQLLKANTSLAIWLIFLAIGGGILALYYARIGYLPDVEWKAALIYLFVASIVGGVIGLLLTISLYLPGVIWSETLVFDPGLKFFYTVPTSDQPGTEPVRELCIRSIFGYLGLPFVFVLLLSHIALLAGKTFYWVFAAGLLGLTFLVMRILLRYKLLAANNFEGHSKPAQGLFSYVWANVKSDLSYVKTKLINLIRRLTNRTKFADTAKDVTRIDLHVFKLSSSFTLSVLLNQISMYLIYRLSGSPAEFRIFVVLTLLCTAGVWLAAHVVALRHRDYPRQAIVAALIVAGLLLFTADRFSSLSIKLMNHYGIGANQQVTLLLSENGQRIVEGLKLSESSDCSLPRICQVEIFSKVGNEYFVSVGGKTFTLPKSDVLSIQAVDRTLAR